MKYWKFHHGGTYGAKQLTGDSMVFMDEIKAIQKEYDKKTEKILFNKIEKAFSERKRPKDMQLLSLNYT